MRSFMLAVVIAVTPLAGFAAPTWQTVSSEPGKRIELDRTTIKRDGNSVQVQGRVILEKELIDARTGAGYRIIEATTRYDCGTRNATTIKRIYKKNETDVIREEEPKGADLPVRSGTLDDKVLREVCRPPRESQEEIVQKANEAASQLKEANDALLKKEAAKTSELAPVVSIKPNLKAEMQGKEAAAATAVVAPAKTPAPKPSVVIVHNKAPEKTKKAPRSGGYMLELTSTSPAAQHGPVHWDYEGLGGPENWSKLDPNNKACGIGQRQSPIDIRDGIKVDLEPIVFNYRPSLFRIADNGHTIQVQLTDNSITLTGKTYELVQFHFHRPSEEKVNGQRFDMVVHLVHKSDDGQLAVLAVLLERGNENPFIQTLWNNLPLEKNITVEPPTTLINPSELLPESMSYYTYMGSLTTPPCTEGVLWLVMKQPVPVSAEQIQIFSRLYKNNVRPIQPAAGRLIKEGR